MSENITIKRQCQMSPYRAALYHYPMRTEPVTLNCCEPVIGHVVRIGAYKL